jgi:4-hydroxy-tetrahydrodipicolinate synthase
LKTPVFKGSCTAIITPFNEKGIDYERLKKNLDYQYENGTAAIVVCGTTGENATLSGDEHQELVRAAIRDTAGRMKVIVGIGSNNTLTALRHAENAKAGGADAVLMVTPYYNKSTQSGLIEHFTYVADRVDLPMILYNVPSRTGIGLQAETCKTLSEHRNIVGIKEASGNISQVAELKKLCGDDIELYSGNDDQIVPIMSLGGLGVISVLSDVAPKYTHELCHKMLNGDVKGACEMQLGALDLINALFCEVNPIPVKTAANLMGQNVGPLRGPLFGMSEANKERLRTELINFGISVQE